MVIRSFGKRDEINVTVECPAEMVNEWLAISARVGWTLQDGIKLGNGFVIAHRPTGLIIDPTAACLYCCRKAADILAKSKIDWDTQGLSAADIVVRPGRLNERLTPAGKKTLKQVRSVLMSCQMASCDPD